jgi:hypothetical protein
MTMCYATSIVAVMVEFGLWLQPYDREQALS